MYRAARDGETGWTRCEALSWNVDVMVVSDDDGAAKDADEDEMEMTLYDKLGEWIRLSAAIYG